MDQEPRSESDCDAKDGVTVEFFGIARRRAGRTRIVVCPGRESIRLGDVLLAAGSRLPGLAGECLDGSRPKVGYLANINACRFTTDPDVMVEAGDHVLLLSADAGG
jgi:molybdopterin converting factor small subunit